MIMRPVVPTLATAPTKNQLLGQFLAASSERRAIGDDTAALVELVLRSRPHPEQGFRSCIGILGLAKRYDAERLDAACARALALGTRSYSSVAAILKNVRQRKAPEPEQPSLLHENIRGSGYYH